MKKLLLFFLFFFAFFLVNTNVLHAQEVTAPPPPSARNLPMNTNPDVPNNFHTYTQNVFIEVLATAVCFTSGVDILTTDGRCLGVDPITKKIGYANPEGGGLVAMMGNLIGATYNLPASTGPYVSYMASNFGISNKSLAQVDCSGLLSNPLQYGICSNDCSALINDLAQYDVCQQTVELNNNTPVNTPKGSTVGQGVGFNGLMPVLNIWKAFRNLTYLLFVVIFVVLGIGIMFRLNIDARTVMTIQNQIPKIIIALILITFSYAIAGFLIDMMYLSIYLIVHVFDGQKLATVHDMSNPFNAVGGLGGISKIASPLAESASGAFMSIFDGALGSNVSRIVTTIASTFLGGKAGGGIGSLAGIVIGGAIGAFAGGQVAIGAGIGSTLGGAAGTLIGGAIAASKGPSLLQLVAQIIIYLIILVAVIKALWQTWIQLIKAYIFILLDVIFAPIFIMGGLLPASSTGGFTSWIRSLLGNLAAFPTVLILFMVGASIQSQISKDRATDAFIPPLVGNFGVANLGDGTGEIIAGIIGLGIILIMPEAVNLSKSFFKSPERKLAQAAMGPIGVGVGMATKPFKNAFGSVMGTDKHTGQPKYLAKKIQGMGAIPSMIFGIDPTIPKEGGHPGERTRMPMFKIPEKLGGGKFKEKFQRGKSLGRGPKNETEQQKVDASKTNEQKSGNSLQNNQTNSPPTTQVRPSSNVQSPQASSNASTPVDNSSASFSPINDAAVESRARSNVSARGTNLDILSSSERDMERDKARRELENESSI